MRKLALSVLIALVILCAISSVVVEAAGPGNDKGSNGKGKAKGHDNQTEQQQNTNNSTSPNPGNSNTGNAKTRKGLDDTKQNQNIYYTDDVLSYHVAKRQPGEYTIVVKKPGKNGEIVYSQEVTVSETGKLDVELTTIPEEWSGVYQVRIIGEDNHHKNDNINVRKRAKERIPNADVIPSDDVIPVLSPDFQPYHEEGNDCVTIVFHHSGTVVEFFRWEHRFEPWSHENEILGESRVNENGEVQAQIAQGEHIAVFDYNESNGLYTFLGELIVIGTYSELIHLWNDGNECSTPYNSVIWCPATSQ